MSRETEFPSLQAAAEAAAAAPSKKENKRALSRSHSRHKQPRREQPAAEETADIDKSEDAAGGQPAAVEDIDVDKSDDAAGRAAAAAEGRGGPDQHLQTVSDRTSEDSASTDNPFEKIMPKTVGTPNPAEVAAESKSPAGAAGAATESPAATAGAADGASPAAGGAAAAQGAKQPSPTQEGASGDRDAQREAADQAHAEAVQAEIDNDLMAAMQCDFTAELVLQVDQLLRDTRREEAAVRVVYAIGELWTAAGADLEGKWHQFKKDKAEDMELDIVQRKIFCVQGAARNWGEVTAKPRSDAALLDDAGKLRIILHNMRVKMADVEELLRKQGSQTALPAKQRAANEQVL